MKITDIASLKVGTPQFRITPTSSGKAPVYQIYNQVDLEEDLMNLHVKGKENKEIKTFDRVNTLKIGDIVFSLVSGVTAIVSKTHQNFLFTQNYVVLNISDVLDAKYLVYLLNADRNIKHQLQLGLQGSMVLKYSVSELRRLKLTNLPTLKRQQIIGSIYFKQQCLQALKERRVENETLLRLAKLAEVNK